MSALLRRHPLLLPVLTTIAVVALVLLRYQRAEAFERFGHLRLPALLGICGAMGLRWLAPTLKFRLITARWERPFTLRQCFVMQLVGTCGSAITPAASGSTPTYLWYMWRQGVPAARAMAVMVYVVSLDAVLFAVSVPLLLPWYLEFVGADAPRGIVWATLLLSLGAFLLAVILLWRPNWVGGAGSLALRRPFPRLQARLAAALEGAQETIIGIRLAGIWFHSACMLLNAIEWFALFSILPLAAMALGLDTAFWDLLRIQDIMQVVAFVFPTPGASGWYEGVLPAAAASAWPPDAAAPLILLWRFFAYWIYLILTVLLGSSMIAQAFESRARAREKLREKTGRERNAE